MTTPVLHHATTPRHQTLVLMGLRGSGKSTLGRELARREHLTFVDLDDVTTQLLGVATAGEAFEKFGQQAFRDAETQALTNELSRAGVLALGGGTPTAPGAAEILRDARNSKRAVIVYLRCHPHVLRERLRMAIDARRPSLTGADPLDEIESVFMQRDPLYCELASYVIEDASDVNDAMLRLTGWHTW